jgi:hypothetical protein
MMISNRFLLGCLAFALLVAVILWWLTGLPWWAIMLIVIAGPPLTAIVLMIVFYAIWVASGAH